MESNLTVILRGVKLISIALWLDDNCCIFKLKLNGFEVVPNVRACFVWNSNLPISLVCFFLNKFVFRFSLESIVLHVYKNSIPNKLWQHNAHSSRVNDSDLCLLSICHVFIIVKEIVYLESPLLSSKVRIPTEARLSALNFIDQDGAKGYHRHLGPVVVILKVEGHKSIFNDTLVLQHLDKVDLVVTASRQSEHSLVRVDVRVHWRIHERHVFHANSVLGFARGLVFSVD